MYLNKAMMELASFAKVFRANYISTRTSINQFQLSYVPFSRSKVSLSFVGRDATLPLIPQSE